MSTTPAARAHHLRLFNLRLFLKQKEKIKQLTGKRENTSAPNILWAQLWQLIILGSVCAGPITKGRKQKTIPVITRIAAPAALFPVQDLREHPS